MSPNPCLILPFVLLLGAMAVGPAAAPRWWSKNYAKVAIGLGALTFSLYFFLLKDTASLGHAAHEYFSFIVLIGSLFIISGGIHIQVPGSATPAKNVGFLLAGALAANLLGTTGAAMLLIRPWIRLNHGRIRAYHLAFFIFIVANAGGCLTPIGDPPLFLGFLEGIPFWWVAQHCWPMWSLSVGLLLVIFYILDRINFSRSPGTTKHPAENWEFNGWLNLLFLAVVIVAAFAKQLPFLREGLMLAAAAGFPFHHQKNRAFGQPVQFPSAHRGRSALRRDLRDDDSGPGLAGS